jgi:hypothetical protein
MSYTQTVPSTGTGSLVWHGERRIPPRLPRNPLPGIIHDLGNLIQIASSAVNIVAHNQSIHTADLEPVIAEAKTSLERAGVLIRLTIGMANKHAGHEAFHNEPRCSGILTAGGSAILFLVGEFAG